MDSAASAVKEHHRAEVISKGSKRIAWSDAEKITDCP